MDEYKSYQLSWQTGNVCVYSILRSSVHLMLVASKTHAFHMTLKLCTKSRRMLKGSIHTKHQRQRKRQCLPQHLEGPVRFTPRVSVNADSLSEQDLNLT